LLFGACSELPAHFRLEGWKMACDNLIRKIEEKGVKRMAKDFVCGAELDETKAGASYDYEGRTYYFCESACKDRFAQSPGEFIN
jgi:YHS domain-containing protein